MIMFDSNLDIFYSDRINDSRFFSGFSTKQLGDSRQLVNLMKFFQNSGLSYQSLVILEQIHSANVFFLDEPVGENVKKISETDGVITDRRGVVLIVRTADCVPMVFCDKKNNLIAVSHQGWRGTYKRLPQVVIKKMLEKGASLDSIVVSLGPAINQCCYSIDEDRYYQFLEEFESYSDKIFSHYRGVHHLNLSKLNFLLLEEAGVKKNNIDCFPFCTSCDRDRFFSFRRDRKVDFGEMFSFLVMN